ncbi:MAG: leucine--tRNA ligase [Chitinispirillaceae bacterium]|nr:leucine--tRNA ligase [Chitinispirillaceae bacterium]
MIKYLPSEIEPKWQQRWEEEGLFTVKTDTAKPKKYVLNMFPYPSGALHMGHVMNYTIGDVIVRRSLMQGFHVLSPIGWDSFGLPAENAAIREGIHPAENIKINIDRMRMQMKRAGWGFDWDREIATSSEAYYHWTQWLFLQFYKAGLAGKKHAPVNWCPNDKTVLANEQVHDGRCERCGTPVEQRNLDQWFFLMSNYAQRLLDNHVQLGGWPERVLKMQKEWIGKSEGATVRFKLENSERYLEVFTTRPDTLWGVTFISMAAQHPLVDTLVEGHPEAAGIMATVKKMRMLGTSDLEVLNREKEGVFTGKYVINPVNGDRVPLYIANFVVMSYGTGVVMAVPAHDQRDFEFARKYGIPIKVVIEPSDATPLKPDSMDTAFTDNGIMTASGEFTGRNNREAMTDIVSYLDKNGFGGRKVTYRLRDWLLSRQRYWGAPIPIVYCDQCGEVAVLEDQLPVLLPKDVSFKPTGESPLKESVSFMYTTCPKCGGPATRDADTMDTFVDSSWYYLRYASAKVESAPFARRDVDYWCPVDTYIGGIEHATMHLIYVRFFTMVLKDLGLLPFEEPVKNLFCQGMICKMAHYCEVDKWLPEEKVRDGKCLVCGGPVVSEVTKMSKTKLNVVSPEQIIETYGADTLRFCVLADNPPDRDQLWSDEGVQGASRYLYRLWDTIGSVLPEIVKAELPTPAILEKLSGEDRELRFATHSTIMRAMQGIETNWQFNTAIARIIELTNSVRKLKDAATPPVLREACETLLLLIAPMTPHLAEELWEQLGNRESIFRHPLPEVDRNALVMDEIPIVVQVNGKLRGQFTANPDAPREALERKALEFDKIQVHLQGKTIRKVIVVPGKLVNIVVS